MSYDVSKLSKLADLKSLAERIESDFAKKSAVTALSNRVDELVTAGGEPNVITAVKVNGTAQTVTDKAVDITVPTAVSGLTNDSKFQTEDQVAATVNSKIASVYKPGGTIAALSADLLVADNEGKVYNLSAEFTTDENFVDTTGKTYPAGTNVGIINTDDGYKFDVMAGFVDLSAYETAAQTETKLEGKVSKVEGKDLSSNDFTDALKTKLESVPEVATTAEVTEMLNEVFGTPAA